MMTRKTAIGVAVLKRMALVAKSEGVIVEAEIDGMIFRVRPYDAGTYPKHDPHDFQTIAEWQAWRDAEGGRKLG